MRRILAVAATTVVCFSSLTVFAATADASQVTVAGQTDTVQAAAKKKPKVYKNCTAAHKDYPHGFRKKGAKDKVRGDSDPVATKLLPVRTKLYKANTKLDRDKDGVACEAK